MAPGQQFRADAEAHIASIRHAKGLSEDSPYNSNVSDLENALTTLSEQLYQSSTHFLLELIQNADDNSYDPKVLPSLHFTYSSGYLRVDCNEVGFSPKNVEALCRVGQSTKKGGDNATRYVGEKGIGFKSVFKAADVVWVSSGPYSFKFDKSKPLGMIAPIWEEFPTTVKDGHTSLYLRLSKDYNLRGLLDELRSLDSKLLIFLRRLKTVTVSISETLRKTFKATFSRTEVGNDIIRLVDNGQPCDYIIKRHKVSNMPPESKRQGVTTSEIILGFPLTADGLAKRESQKAYAFLPIRDYGFEFLIQADFLLVASREDIDESSKWNHALRDALFPAFTDAVRGFNKGKLAYSWIRYLPTSQPLLSFLKPFHLELQEKLRDQAVIHAQSGSLVAPNSVTSVPQKFTFEGLPLTHNSELSGTYLSNKYMDSDMEFIKVLRVSEMTDNAFVMDLKSCIERQGSDFQKKSNAWHAHLAGILVRLSSSESYLLKNLAIIPLSDGKWVCALGREILFPSNTNEFELPSGLELAVVDSKAASNPERRNLYRLLEVGELEQEPVVRHIQNIHRDGRVEKNSITRAALVSQIQFLYTTGWKNPTFQRFWFTDELGERVHGSQLYQDSSKPYSASQFFGAYRNSGKFHFIHKDYLTAAGKSRELWSRWLEEKMEVATMPRLVQPTNQDGFVLSEDFEFIIKTFPSADILLLLRDNWNEYSKYFDPVELEKHRADLSNKYSSIHLVTSAYRLKEKLGSMLVTCTDGKKMRLDKTFLPTKELLVASQDSVPFLSIPEPNNPRWETFKILGVSIKADVSFYLRSLEALAVAGSHDSERIERLYGTIQARCENDTDSLTVKRLFNSKDVVYIPPSPYGSPPSWTRLSRCRWKGAPLPYICQDTRTFVSLRNIYPDNKRLFCDILGVTDTLFSDIVYEAKQFAAGDSLTHITSVFHAMEKMLEEHELFSTSHFDLSGINFPVSKNWRTDSDKAKSFQKAEKGSEWFVADTAPLRTMFAGVIPLLDIEVDDLAAMSEVLQEAGLGDRLLSNLAKSIPRTRGVVEMNHGLTELFKSKVDFIVRLLPTSKQHRKRRQEVIRQMRNLEVYTADEVIQEWQVEYKGKAVKGPPGNGRVAILAKKDTMKIYLAAKSGYDLADPEIELVDEFFNFCGMIPHNPEHSEMCLHIALSQNDPAKIMKVFTDKGIPSLESLRFADSAGQRTSEDDGDDALPPYSSDKKGRLFGSDDKKLPLREPKGFRLAEVAGAVVALPAAAVIGLSRFARRKRLFDGEDDTSAIRAKPVKEPKKKKVTSVETKKVESSALQVQFQKYKESFCRTPNPLSIGLPDIRNLFQTSEDIAFLGELTVHRMLDETLGRTYNSVQHWTSPRRNRAPANLPAWTGEERENFKFLDRNGAFTKLLINDSFPAAEKWITRPPTYHIDVKSTRKDLNSEFLLSAKEIKRAKDFSVMVQQMKGNEDSIPKDVYIIARVYDVDASVRDVKGKGKEVDKVVFLVDPWEYYHADKLTLRLGKGHGKIV